MSYTYKKIEGDFPGPLYEIDEVMAFLVCVVEDEKTARLFSASDELLKALEGVESWMVDYANPTQCGYHFHLADVRAAIAKAKGGAA